jgi:hypothetical protein
MKIEVNKTTVQKKMERGDWEDNELNRKYEKTVRRLKQMHAKKM